MIKYVYNPLSGKFDTIDLTKIGSIVDGTVGSVLFIGTDNKLAEDNDNLFWDDATNILKLGGDLWINADNKSILFGAAQDAGIYYDGTDMVFDSQLVGSGNFLFKNGKVGIGTLTPDLNLTVVEAATAGGLGFDVYSDTIAHEPVFYFRKSHSDTTGIFAETLDGENLGQITWRGVGSNATAFRPGANIKVEQVGDAAAAAIPADPVTAAVPIPAVEPTEPNQANIGVITSA